jgi:hypothetical protein
VFGRLLLAVVVSAALGAGLWAAVDRLFVDDGETTAEAATDEDVLPLELWARRFGAICKLEQKHTKAWLRAVRTAHTYADAEIRMVGANKIGKRSVDLLRRLPPPEGSERERRTILRFLERKQRVAEAMVESVRQHDDRAFFRQAERLFDLSVRMNKIMVKLGVEGCVPIPKEKLPSERRLVV